MSCHPAPLTHHTTPLPPSQPPPAAAPPPPPAGGEAPAPDGVMRQLSTNGGEPIELGASAAGEGEEDIQKALFVGNYDGAVELCFKVGCITATLVLSLWSDRLAAALLSPA